MTTLLAPRVVSLAEAQAHVNFVVFEPRELPDATRIETTLRPEQAPGRPPGLRPAEIGQTPWSDGNPCSLRTTIAGDGRALRIKQFLYDWAPNAASIAALWDSPLVHPFPCRDAIGWTGIDYKGCQGATVQLARTTIELSVLEGSFEREEIEALLAGLEIAEPRGAEVVDETPFHELSYWVRYRHVPYGPPYGLWKCGHRRPYQRTVESVPVRVLETRQAKLDSRLALGRKVTGGEVETILRLSRSETAWLLATTRESSAIPVPPRPEDRPCEVRETRRLRGTAVFVAALTRRHGAWEAIWEEAGHRYALWTSALTGDAEERFVSLLSSLAQAAR